MTDMTRKLALLCTVSVLTLGLAACNSTGTKTPAGGTPTPPAGQGDTSELGKARTAAKTAMDAAKTASDGAETQAGNAETAAMGLALIQTGDPMAKKKAMEAREAARKAMAAYEKAKAESDKAAAATTITAAVTARRAAEAARAEAVKQQMAAAAAAKAATDAAAKEVRVTYDDNGKATVSVGDTKIVAGSPKVETTTGGVTVTTGKVDDGDLSGANPSDGDLKLVNLSRDFRKQSTAYDPDTKEYQTGIRGQQILYGSVTDSENSRMYLVDKYITTTTVKGYRKAKNNTNTADGDTVTAAAKTPENPFGSVDGKPIMRAEGQFYVTDTQEDTELTTGDYHDWINRNTPDANAGVGVYYYMDGSDKKYLIPDGPSGGNVYRRIFVFDVTNFPVAKAYEHMNFGMWNKEKKTADRSDLGTAFVAALPGGEGVTPVAGMPNFGKATYKGHAVWQRREQHEEGNGKIVSQAGNATTTADFGKNTISTDLFFATIQRDNREGNYNAIVATLHGTIDGNEFSGDKVTNVNAERIMGYRTDGLDAIVDARVQLHRSRVDLEPSLNGSGYVVKEYRGNFFGAGAEEVGGVFDVTSEGKKKGELRGSFGGRKVEAE